jgi:hypothetical protein
MFVRQTGAMRTGKQWVAVMAALLLVACESMKNVERSNVEPEQVRAWNSADITRARKDSPFLKAHMRNGDLFVLEDWDVVAATGSVTGQGTHYDARRRQLGKGEQTVPIDSVAVFETNHLVTSGVVVALTVMAAVTAAVAIYCAANPKDCFGSCPTFYVGDDDRPLAEGFSASIAPSLEDTDIDALYPLRGAGPLEIVMRNEAQETHVVRYVNVLAAPHAAAARVFADPDGTLWECAPPVPPSAASAEEGDILPLVSAPDHRERFSLADSTYLAARETLMLAFDNPPRDGRCGIVVGCRQSLLSTYLLYQTFAYMGTQAGHWIAELERGTMGDAGSELVDILGGIVVRVEKTPGEWMVVGEIDEFGPIATDRHLLMFETPPQWTGRVELELTKGGWRIDDVALVRPVRSVEPLRLSPVAVARDGADDNDALAVLLDPARALTTLPGDAYTLLYDIPADGEYELFLESRGYYLEWIREQWLREESSERLAEMFFDPRAALTRLAPDYKRIEPGMEQAFWSSRYEKP